MLGATLPMLGAVWDNSCLARPSTSLTPPTGGAPATFLPHCAAWVVNTTDAVWLPAGFDGLESPHLAIVTRRSGHIVLVDPESARAGGDAIVQRHQLGGVLARIVADASTGTLYVADNKNRRVYGVQASELAAGDVDEETYELDFAARDIIADQGRLYAATGNALVWFEGDESETNRFISALGLGLVPEAILTDGAIAVVTENRVENYSRDGVTRILDAEGNRVRRVYTFVSPE